MLFDNTVMNAVLDLSDAEYPKIWARQCRIEDMRRAIRGAHDPWVRICVRLSRLFS